MKIGTDPQRLIKYIRQRLDYPVEPGRKEKIQSSTDNWIIREYMNHISGKIEQLLALQKTLCKEYEKENKVLLETIEAQKEHIYLLERIVDNQNKIIKELEKS